MSNSNVGEISLDKPSPIDISSIKMPEIKKKVHIPKTMKQIQDEYNALNPVENPPNVLSTDNDTEANSNSLQTEMKLTPAELYFETENPNPIDLHYIYKKIRKSYTFFGNQQGDPLFIIGPQWFMYVILSIIVFGVIITFLYLFWEVYSGTFKVIGIVLLSVFQLAYTYTFIINPGYPKNDIGRRCGEPREEYKFCPDCKFFVKLSNKVNHCFDCGICVEGYDHHCPWTSKCIGRRNLISFYLFMGSIMSIFAYFIYALVSAPSLE